MKKIMMSTLVSMCIFLSCNAVVGVVQDDQVSETICAMAGIRFHVGDLVQVDQPDNPFHGVIAYVIDCDFDRIQEYRRLHNCPDYCIDYSLISLHDQQRFECCQCYLVPAQIR